MSSIHSKNTKPELVVRSLLHSLGFRFRLHRKDLPGKPDIVLPKYQTVIFVNGCFWHQHKKCKDGRVPETNYNFWKDKLGKNVERDERNRCKLIALGWNVLTIWECELKSITKLKKRILKELTSQ